MHRKPAWPAKPAKVQDAESGMVMEKIAQFGRKWEIQSCAAGSLDPMCRLRASKALATLVAMLEQHKAVAYKAQTRHVASREVPWGSLLAALLAPTAPAAARALALPAAAVLVGFMPQVVPLGCCPLLVALLDAPVGDCDGPTGQVTVGAHAVTCLLALVPAWRSAALQPHWLANHGSARLRAHLRRCVASSTGHQPLRQQPQGAVGGPGPSGGRGGCCGCLPSLADALRLLFVLVRLAGYMRREVTARVCSWLPLLLDAHDVAAVAGHPEAAATAAKAAKARDAGLTPVGGSGAGDVPALVLEVLRQLATCRRFWVALLHPPQRSSAAAGELSACCCGGGCSPAPQCAVRLLATLSAHLRPLRRVATGGFGPHLLPPLLPAAAALLCHPGLWRSGSRVRGAAGASGAAPLLAARREALEAVLGALAACGDGGDVVAATPLLPVLAAALMPPAVPYGGKDPARELPESQLWDKALAPTLALAARALLGGAGVAGGSGGAATPLEAATGATEVPTLSTSLGRGGGGDSGGEGAEAAAGFLLLRLLAPMASAEQVERAAGMAAGMARPSGSLGAAAAAADTAASGCAAAAAAAAAAAPATRVLIGHFAALGGASASPGGCAASSVRRQLDAEGELAGGPHGAGQQLRRLLLLAAASTTAGFGTAIPESTRQQLPAVCGGADIIISSSCPSDEALMAEWYGGQRRLHALACCCRELLASSPPPRGLLGPMALHACLAALLYTARGLPRPAVYAVVGHNHHNHHNHHNDIHSGTPWPSLGRLLSTLACADTAAASSDLQPSRDPRGSPPLQGPAAGAPEGARGLAGWLGWRQRVSGGGGGCSDDDDGDEGAQDRDDDGGDNDGDGEFADGGGVGAATAPARFLSAVRRRLAGEVRCTATSLLSACFGQLGGWAPLLPPPPPLPPSTPPNEHQATAAAPASSGAGDSGCPGGLFGSADLLSEYSDAGFTFGGTRAAEAEAEVVAAPAALIAAGCPALASKLCQALLVSQGARGEEEDERGAKRPPGAAAAPRDGSGAAHGAGGAVGARCSRVDGRGDGGGDGGGGDGGGDGGRDGRGGGGGALGRVVVVGWPRAVRVPMGSRVPRPAFRALLAYLAGGAASLPGAAAEGEEDWGGRRTQAGPAPGLLPGARDVSTLAAALGLMELRAVARAVLPRPGSVPPPPLPHLRPLMPRHMLLLPLSPPPPPPPPPQQQHPDPCTTQTDPDCRPREEWHDEEEDEEEKGEECGRGLACDIVGANIGACDGAAGTAQTVAPPQHERPTGHPHLEDQLAAIMRWEEEQDALARLAAGSGGEGGGGASGEPAGSGLPAFPAIDMCCLRGGSGSAGGGSGPQPWPADCVIAAPLLWRPGGQPAACAPSAASAACVAEAAAGSSGGSGSRGGAGGGTNHAETRGGSDATPSPGEGAAQAGRLAPAPEPASTGANVCRTVLIPAHRVVLAVSCEYFSALCSERWRPGEGQAAAGGLYLRATREAAGSGQDPAVEAAGGPGGARAVALALRVKLLRVPGCDADAVLAVLQHLHHHHHRNDTDTDTARGLGAALLPCEWAPTAWPPRDVGSTASVVAADAVSSCESGFSSEPADGCSSCSHSGGRIVDDRGRSETLTARSTPGGCTARGGEGLRGRAEWDRDPAVPPGPYHPDGASGGGGIGGGGDSCEDGTCGLCRELRLRLRVLLACNALLLPGLEARMAQRVLALLRGQHSRSRRPLVAGSDTPAGSEAAGTSSPPRLAAGCLLTAARDGTVLQLPWLVEAAVEELTKHCASADVQQAAEWHDLPRAVQESWARRARNPADASAATTAAQSPATAAVSVLGQDGRLRGEARAGGAGRGGGGRRADTRAVSSGGAGLSLAMRLLKETVG